MSGAWVLSNPHLQTLWGPRFRRLPEIERREEKLLLADGDHVWLTCAGPEPVAGQPQVLLLHGLAGCHDSHYIRGLQHRLSQQGVPSVAMNARGALRPNDRARGYHAGEWEDIAEVVGYLVRRAPHSEIRAAGFSLGGSRLLNYLARHADGPVNRAVAVCVPLLLDECANRVDRGFSRVYRNHLIGELLARLRAKHQYLQQVAPEQAGLIDALGPLDGIRSFWQFDEHVQAPLHGFAGARDYYDRCSAKPQLAHIEVPTLLIQAPDDPFMTDAIMPAVSELGPRMQLETPPGGHVGFVQGSLWRPRYWLEERVPEFLLGS